MILYINLLRVAIHLGHLILLAMILKARLDAG